MDSTDPQQHPWDQLSVAELRGLHSAADPAPVVCEDADEVHVSALARMAAGWADLVIVGLVTTAILSGVLVAGYSLRVTALPWAMGVALLWWTLCSVVCVRIRRGSPGMLIAGIVFSNEVAGYRIAWTVIAAAIVALFLGVPALWGGPTRSLYSVASGSPIIPV